MSKRFGIIGAGNGGHAFAAYLGEKGQSVYMYDIDESVIQKINEQGGIQADGEIEGFFPVEKATGSLQELVQYSDIIMVVTPSNAHRIIATNMAPYLREDQTVILNPGSTGGALEFRTIFQDENCTAQVTILETQSLLFACRLNRPGYVSIYGIKKELPFSAIPSNRSESAYGMLHSIFPEWTVGKNVLEISLGNINAVLHPAPSLFSLTHIATTKPFLHYKEGVTSTVEAVLEKLDRERVEIGSAYGLTIPTTKESLKKFYDVKGETLSEMVQSNKAYDTITGASSLTNRYFLEDVPMGLIPMRELGKIAGVQTPVMDAIIHLVESLVGSEAFAHARTLEKLGLVGMDVDAVNSFMETGMNYQLSQ